MEAATIANDSGVFSVTATAIVVNGSDFRETISVKDHNCVLKYDECSSTMESDELMHLAILLHIR